MQDVDDLSGLFAEFKAKIAELVLGKDLSDKELYKEVRKASFEVELFLSKD